MNGKRKLIFSVLAIMLLSILGVAGYYWYESTYFVSTEDAKVTADIIRVAPQITGKLVEFNIKEGQDVTKDEILGRQEMNSLPDSSLELSILRAPITGIVIKAQGTVGEVISPGQVLAMIFNPSKVYINANIEEGKIERLQKGQQVDITFDQYKDKKVTGKIESIGLAANAVFSILPTSTSGNFTKVVQKIPVKISLDKTNTKLAPGTNAIVKIHVK